MDATTARVAWLHHRLVEICPDCQEAHRGDAATIHREAGDAALVEYESDFFPLEGHLGGAWQVAPKVPGADGFEDYFECQRMVGKWM